MSTVLIYGPDGETTGRITGYDPDGFPEGEDWHAARERETQSMLRAILRDVPLPDDDDQADDDMPIPRRGS